MSKRSTPTPGAPRDALLLSAFVLSGFCGLAYEIVWTRLLVLATGSENMAVLGVLGGYFLGLCLGAWFFHRRVVLASRPALWYVVFELVAAGYALLSLLLIPKLVAVLPAVLEPVIGLETSPVSLAVSLLISGSVLLPATVCLGGTLPAVVEARRRVREGRGERVRGLGRLYGANTLGATLGVLGTVYLLLPRLGMVGATGVATCCGLAAAGLAFLWQRGVEMHSQTADAAMEHAAGQRTAWRLVLLFFTGFAAMALEVAAVRILGQVLSNSIYTFANVLSVFLVGNAAGAWAYVRWSQKRTGDHRLATAMLLLALCATALLAAFPLANALGLRHLLAPAGSGFLRSIAMELLLAGMVFLAPTFFMGMLFTHLVAGYSGVGIGHAVAINTLGATVAPIVLGIFVVSALGYTPSYYLVPLLYGVLFIVTAGHRLLASPRLPAAASVVVVVAIAAPRSLAIVAGEPGQTVLKRWESAMGHVMVLGNRASRPGGAPARDLKIDRHHKMGGGAGYAEKRWSHTGLLLSPRRGSALFLGLGTAASLAAARAYDFERIEGVELVPEVIEALPWFASINDTAWRDPRVHIRCADARRFVAAVDRQYEAIVADLYHPDASGVSSLFSRDHFRRIRSRLTSDGVFVQFLPVFQLNTATLSTIVRTFIDVFPNTHCFQGHHALVAPIVLVAFTHEEHHPLMSLDSMNAYVNSRPRIKACIMGADDLMGSYLCGPGELREFGGAGPVNTDLNPYVMFGGAYVAYETGEHQPWSGLAAIREHRVVPPATWPGKLVSSADSALWQSARAQSRALDHVFTAQRLAFGTSPENRPVQSVKHYLAAYAVHPGFMIHLGMPYLLRPSWQQHRDLIFRSMLHATPDLVWLRKLYESMQPPSSAAASGAD
jgi:spermidine synthase